MIDQAIYHAGTDKIYGVKGQWVFKFNATTGALEASLKFAPDIGGVSSITSIGTKLYIGTTYSGGDNVNSILPYKLRDIYVVDTTTFALPVSRFNFDSKLTVFFGARNVEQWAIGWRHLLTDGTKLFGDLDEGQIFRVDPTNLPGYAFQGFDCPPDMAYDPTNVVLWFTQPYSPNVFAVDATNFANSCSDTGGMSDAVNGICFCVAQNKAYFVQGDFNIGMISAAGHFPGFTNFGFTLFNTGRINANPIHVKAVNNLVGNPLNGKVLIPAWDDDTVLVWNPATDNPADMGVKAGFTSPVDIVSTPTKNWAVQTGTTPLKEIV